MYDAAPRDDLEQLSRSLTITGGRTITLTSRTGEIPITIVSTYRYAIHALTELRDSALDFLGTCSRPVLTILATKSTASECPVRARTSGDSRLAVMVVAPVGGLTLVSGSLKIQSTAVSGVAIALSIGALLVLGAWWLRSVLRHRRQKLSRAVALAAIGESSPSA
jgi:hypothetical protein